MRAGFLQGECYKKREVNDSMAHVMTEGRGTSKGNESHELEMTPSANQKIHVKKTERPAPQENQVRDLYSRLERTKKDKKEGNEKFSFAKSKELTIIKQTPMCG